MKYPLGSPAAMRQEPSTRPPEDPRDICESRGWHTPVRAPYLGQFERYECSVCGMVILPEEDKE